MANPVEQFCEAVRQRRPFVEMTSMTGLQSLYNQAIKRDPKIMGALQLDKVQGTTQRGSGLMSVMKTYRLTLVYTPGLPKYEDIIMDDGRWVPSEMVKKGHDPQCFYVVTKEPAALYQRMQDDFGSMQELNPLIMDGNVQSLEASKDGYQYVQITYRLPIDAEQYAQMMTLARRQVAAICRRHFGMGERGIGTMSLPVPIKAFMPFSYLQQHCVFNALADKTKKDEQPQEPWASTPYGPISRNSGTAMGIASAYKMFMDYLALPCQLVHGFVMDEGNMIEHTWCMLEIGGEHYHVDPTFGIDCEDVLVDTFLKSDRDMRATHDWDPSRYPACSYASVSYRNVSAYVRSHLGELLHAGVDERYVSDDFVME